MFPTQNFLIDFETLGTNESECVVLDCSAIVFDSTRFTTNPYTFGEIIKDARRWKFELKHQKKEYNWTAEKDALAFWGTVDKDTLKHIGPQDTDITVTEFCEDFLTWIKNQPEVDIVWSRGNTLDIPTLWRLFRATGKIGFCNNYLPFWKVRDTRTFIDAKLDFKVRNDFIPTTEEFWKINFKKHRSTHDIAADVLRLQAIVRGESELEYDGE